MGGPFRFGTTPFPIISMIKTSSWCAVFAVIVAGFPAAFAQTPLSTLTLEQTLRTVEQVNVNVLLGREAVAQAVEQTRQIRAGVLPDVSLSAQQFRTKSVSLPKGVPTQSGASNRFSTALDGAYNILDPRGLSATHAARVGVQAVKYDYRAVVQNVLATAAETYFSHLRNVRRITVLDANVRRARALLDLAQNQAAAGAATKIDVTRAEALLAQAQFARLQQDTTVYQTELLLKQLLDFDTAGPLHLADFTVRREISAEFTIAMERTAFEDRADWLRGQKALEQAKLNVQTARFERLPVLALSGQYGYVGSEVFSEGKKSAWFAGAIISVPVFDGLRSNADKRLALSRQRAVEVRQRSLELQISAELRLATQNASSRFAQIEVAGTSLRLAEEELRLAQVRFEQGVADNREVIEAQNRLALAGDSFNEAIYQLNLSHLELARAKGDVRKILAEKAK